MSIRFTNCSLLTDESTLDRDCALQVENGLITGVGSMKESSAWPQADREISLDGCIVLAGLTDTHIHVENWARRKSQVSLEAVTGLKDLINLVEDLVLQREAAGDTSTLILGGWNEELYPERRPPTITELDEISEHTPIILTRICGHVCVVNSAVLRDFDWQTYASKDPGSVGLDATKRPNGILTEKTMAALLKSRKKPGLGKQEDLLEFGLKSMAAFGLTAVFSQETNNLEDLAFLDHLTALYEKDQALPSYYAQIGLSHPDEIQGFLDLQEKYKDHPRIKISSVKLFKDGSLGGRTAFLRQAYSDDPTKTGLDLIPYQDLVEWFEKTNRAGVQLTIHAIGDRAVAEIIDAFEAACHKEEDWLNPRRHSIIHCQITDQGLLQRLAKAKLHVITQPLFAKSDWPMALSRLGSERRDQAYDYRGILKLGIHQAFSSDSPVESANPLLTLAAAIDHPQTEKSLSLAEAVAAYSKEAAYILSEEGERGAIRVGLKGDFTVLQAVSEEDLQAENLRKLEIALTVRDGKIIHQK